MREGGPLLLFKLGTCDARSSQWQVRAQEQGRWPVCGLGAPASECLPTHHLHHHCTGAGLVQLQPSQVAFDQL